MAETTVTLPAALILLLIIFVVAAMMGTNIGQGIFQYLDKYLPGLSGTSNITTPDYKVAEYSTNALVCAMNAVITGDGSKCDKYYQPSQLGGGKGDAGTDGVGSFGERLLPTGLAAADSTEAVTIPVEKMAWVDCSNLEQSKSCTVHNFQLPQYVSNAEDYIIKYGDPKYIVYWNTFPMEESSWTYKVDWVTHAAIFAISVIPFGKITAIGVKAGLGTVQEIARFGTKKLTRAWVKNAIKQRLLKTLELRFTTKKFAKYLVGVGAKATILESGAKLIELIDSVMDKYEPVPNSIVLKSPLSESVKFGLDSSWKDNPVLVKWNPEILGASANFHLVSPCYLDEFEVSKEKVTCSSFIKDGESGAVFCQEMKEAKNWIECGDISDESLNNYFGYENAGIISEIRQSENRDMYIYDDNGVLSRINIVYHSEKSGKETYVDSIEFSEVKKFYQTSEGVTIDYDMETYSAKLHSDSEESDITIKCRQRHPDDYFYSKAAQEETEPIDPNFECWIEGGGSGLEYMNFKLGNIMKETVIEATVVESCDTETKKCGMVIDATEQPDSEELSGERMLSVDRGRLFSQKMNDVIDIELIDYSGDGQWDTIKESKPRLISTMNPERYVIMSDIGSDGEPENIEVGNCDKDAIIVDFGRISEHQSKVESNNYCLRHKSTTELVIKWGGRVAGGTISTLGILSGWGTIPTMLVFAAGSALGTATEIGTEMSSDWPG